MILLSANSLSDLIIPLGSLGMVGILIGGMLLSFNLQQKGMKTLTPKQTEVYLEGFDKQNQYLYSIITTILCVIYVVVMVLDDKHVLIYSTIYISLILITMVGVNSYNNSKFKKLDLPRQFVRNYTLAKAIETVSWGLFLAWTGYMGLSSF